MITFFKKKKTKSTIQTLGIMRTIIPDTFIDGNTNPIWDNNHILLKNSKKETIYVGSKKTSSEL
jgi:hypothetical protein